MDYDVLRPMYTVVRYTESVYKIIKFKRSTNCLPYFDDDVEDETGCKLKFDSSLSRARRMVFEYAICNPWDFFFTGTISPQKFDRYNWDGIREAFKDWIKDIRKSYGSHIHYLLVPEHHKSGAWHVHGFISGLPASRLSLFQKGIHPYKLVKAGFLNWNDFEKKFGFCSLGKIRNKMAASYYITKYINKELTSRRSDVGQHLYTCSRGLNRASKAFDVYASSPFLDSFLTNEYEFCSTGMVDGQDWTFGLDLDSADFALLDDVDFSSLSLSASSFEPDQEDISTVDLFVQLEQLVLKGW